MKESVELTLILLDAGGRRKGRPRERERVPAEIMQYACETAPLVLGSTTSQMHFRNQHTSCRQPPSSYCQMMLLVLMMAHYWFMESA